MLNPALQKIDEFFKKNGYQTESNKKFEEKNLKPEIYAFKKGHSFWKFLPYEDHIFIYELEDSDPHMVENLHETARKYVNGTFSKPKWMRYKIPNIVTIVVNNSGFSAEAIKYATTPVAFGVGGEKHSVHLIDLKNKRLYNHGLQTVRGVHVQTGVFVAVRHKKANPSNRVNLLVTEMCQSFGITAE